MGRLSTGPQKLSTSVSVGETHFAHERPPPRIGVQGAEQWDDFCVGETGVMLHERALEPLEGAVGLAAGRVHLGDPIGGGGCVPCTSCSSDSCASVGRHAA